jgi:hypothetical protein
VEILNNPNLFIPILIWSLIWKGVALWKTAGKKQLVWFVIILTVNTLGLLEIAYIFYLNHYDIDHGKILKFLNKKFKK